MQQYRLWADLLEMISSKDLSVLVDSQVTTSQQFALLVGTLISRGPFQPLQMQLLKYLEHEIFRE